MRDVILIAIAGALGSLCRYGVGLWSRAAFGTGFPWGTLTVNVLGCLILGFVMQAGLAVPGLTRSMHTAVSVGFLGAFTTFSTFGYDTIRFLDGGQWSAAALNVVANLTLGGLAAVAGIVLGRQLLALG